MYVTECPRIAVLYYLRMAGKKEGEVIISSVGKKKMKKRKANEMRMCGGR